VIVCNQNAHHRALTHISTAADDVEFEGREISSRTATLATPL
jgi:hypothetical protein